MQNNITEQDAFSRISDARMGCLVNASEPYLVALRANLIRWTADVETQLAIIEMRRQCRLEDRG
jgi:hypothetical protein